MNWPLWFQSLCGGALIGLAAAVFLLLNGRIAGISGILGSLFKSADSQAATNIAFLVGLILGPLVFLAQAGHWPRVEIAAGPAMLIVAGLLVGFGTRLGSGCTSGHGVCGLARLSPRSIAAVSTFMLAAIATVYITHHLLAGTLS